MERRNPFRLPKTQRPIFMLLLVFHLLVWDNLSSPMRLTSFMFLCSWELMCLCYIFKTYHIIALSGLKTFLLIYNIGLKNLSNGFSCKLAPFIWPLEQYFGRVWFSLTKPSNFKVLCNPRNLRILRDWITKL